MFLNCRINSIVRKTIAFMVLRNAGKIMDLLQFTQKPIQFREQGERPGTERDKRFPLIIIYPAGAQVAVPKTWRRLPSGEIEATYNNYQELYWSVHLSAWIKEWSAEPPGELHQAEMFPHHPRGAAYDL
jgi:hypothetical protein